MARLPIIFEIYHLKKPIFSKIFSQIYDFLATTMMGCLFFGLANGRLNQVFYMPIKPMVARNVSLAIIVRKGGFCVSQPFMYYA